MNRLNRIELFRALRVVAISGLVATMGCDSRPREIVLPAIDRSAEESQPMVPHPEYVNWSKFPVKSYVIRNRSVVNEHGQVTVKTKLWLESISEKEVTVASQITVERPNEAVVTNPVDSVRYPATFRLPKGMKAEQFLLPSLRASSKGTETCAIGDKEFSASVFEWEEVNETGPMSVKVWHCDEIPGRVIKQEFLTKSSQTTTTENVTEVHIESSTNES